MAISRLIQDKFFTSLPYPASSCAGKTIVVTGSNIGLGKEAARHYARLEASKLILAVRSVEKGNAAMADIRYTTGIAEDAIEVWSLDLASYESVLAFADRVSMELDRLDVFIGNAGMAPFGFTMAEQDEMTLTVNVVSSTLLALLVLPVLRSTAQRHDTKTNLCIVSSGAGSIAHFPEQDAPDGQIYLALSDEKNVDMKQRYSVSKLLQLLAMRSICEQLPPQYPVVINAVTPGFCISALGRHRSWAFWLMRQTLGRSTEFGSRTLVHAGNAGMETHKRFLRDCEVTQDAPFVRSAEGRALQDRVWKELAHKLELVKPGIASLEYLQGS